jgi:hypothetical protein
MFQSRGERKIAAFLDSLNIQYTYQPPVMIKDRGYKAANLRHRASPQKPGLITAIF